eukprot:jgi/Tetstr1/435486/TSEL_024391.t1
MLPLSGDQRRCQRARLFGNVTESVGEGKWMVRWDDAPADVQESGQALRCEQATAGRTPPSAASTPRGQGSAVGPFVPPRPAAAADASAKALGGSRGTIVTGGVVSDTGTPTEIPSIPATSSPASILATQPLPADNLDMPAESQDSQPGVELAKELGDSSGDEEAPEQYVGGASPDDGHEDAAWISPAPGTTVVMKQGSKIATWSVFNLDIAEEMAKMRDTTAQREAARTLPVGLRDGLPIGVGSVDLVQLWVMMYPCDLSADLEKVNAAGLRRSSTQKLISMHEYVRFWELVIAGALYSQQGRNLWATNITFDGLRDQPNFQRYMPLHRFKYIRSLIKYAKADLDSTPRATKLGGLPNLSFIYRKPKPLGTEMKTVCDCDTGVMTYIEIQEGRDPMRVKPHAAEHGVTTACVMRMAETCTSTNSTLLGDAWFGSVKAAVQVGKMGRHFIGVVKTGHGLFPKAFLKSQLTSAPAGSRVALSAIVDGVDLMAVGYKYNMRKVLFLVATAGASPLEDGNPYIQRWADDFGNTVTRSIPRPYVLSNYFERSPRVDNHNQSRQHDLALEEAWKTQDCWFRLATTLCGIVTTDCRKITKFHAPYAHPYASMTIKDFSELMARALIYNGLDGDLAPSRPPGHRLAIAPKRYLDTTDQHTPGNHGRYANGRSKQSRCCRCYRDEGEEHWSSFYCVHCGITLCMPSSVHSRDCWQHHLHCDETAIRRMKHARAG